MKLSIHTATYNRGYIIEEAYKSLQNQTCYDFEWVVTDNGSTDNTEELFQKWVRDETRFPIRYYKIPERGIPRALNFGVNHVNGEYFFMLDSDDKLLPNAVELILQKLPQIENREDYVGIGFVIVFPNMQPVKGVWPKVNEHGFIDCTNLERKYYDLDADMREVYKVAIMKEFPFKVWDGEVFAPEQLCFDDMALAGYKIRWFSEAIYMCEYLNDGLTNGNWNLNRRNPMGFAMLANQRIKYSKGLSKIRAAADHIALSTVGKNPSYILKTNSPLSTLLAIPLGLVLAIRRHEQYKWDDPVNRSNFK